jgi:hypothetical protein
MSRESYYITQEAAAAVTAAVERITAALGGDLPKHVPLSALLLAGAERADEIATQLAEQQAAALKQRLAALEKPAT